MELLWLAGEEADGGAIAAQLDWMGKASVLLVELGFQELLCKGWLRWQEHSAGSHLSAEAGSPGQASPWSALCERGPWAEGAARLCFCF